MELSRTNVSGDLSDLRNHEALKMLNVSWTPISGNISMLENLTQIKWLELSGTQMSGDLSVLNKHKQLQVLDLSQTTVCNIDAIVGMHRLEKAILSRTAVTGWITDSWLGCCKSLVELHLAVGSSAVATSAGKGRVKVSFFEMRRDSRGFPSAFQRLRRAKSALWMLILVQSSTSNPIICFQP